MTRSPCAAGNRQKAFIMIITGNLAQILFTRGRGENVLALFPTEITYESSEPYLKFCVRNPVHYQLCGERAIYGENRLCFLCGR
eukprot:6207432-Pleurochrysis_carterae.AAC.3